MISDIHGFLTCLFHDTATVIEKVEWRKDCSSEIENYLEKYDVDFDVFKHAWTKQDIKPYTYSENLVKNYFKYRVEYCHSIDHGIIAGYLLYDRMMKNYNNAWKKCSNTDSNEKYEYFQYDNLTWRKEQLSHFAIIADAIIAHNIWHSMNTEESQEIYRQYGLNPLIYGFNNRITISKNPLLFYLGLFDSIEPIKRFEICEYLNRINIQQIQQNILMIQVLDDFISAERLTKYFAGILNMQDWLSVDVEEISPKEVIIIIK